jgi:hypothetical protein
MRIVRITKRYTRKISYDYKSWEFSTELTADVNVESDEDLVKASSDLFKKVVRCVTEDMKKVAEKYLSEKEEQS